MQKESKVPEKLISDDSFYRRQSGRNPDHKRVVAEELLRLKLIRDGDPLVLDAGTSATIIAELIFGSELKNLSILTHNIEVFQKFYSGSHGGGHEVLLTGGAFDPNYNALYGSFAESAYSAFSPRVVILAISGLIAAKDLGHQSGIYCHAVVETRLKRTLFTLPTDRRIVVADYSKIGRVDSHLFGTIAELKSNVSPGGDYLITTQPPSPPVKDRAAAASEVYRKTIAQLREWNVSVIEVPAPATETVAEGQGAAPGYRGR